MDEQLPAPNAPRLAPLESTGEERGQVPHSDLANSTSDGSRVVRIKANVDAEKPKPKVSQGQPHHVHADTWDAHDTDQRGGVSEQPHSAIQLRSGIRRDNTFDTAHVDLVWK